jgi:hypothetical protein
MIAKIMKNRVYYWCEGCDHIHMVFFKAPQQGYTGPVWEFNQDPINPTISPSVRHFYTHPETKNQVTTCHYWIKNGNIEYCGDCEHKYAGQTRKLVDIPENYGLPQEE